MDRRRWRALLTQRYRDFFDAYGRPTPAVFPFECGDGWAIILWQMCRALRQAQRDFGVQPLITDIKEKRGTLRVYDASIITHSGAAGEQAIERIIAAAEQLSETTCEVCGYQGHLFGPGDVLPRCPRCAARDGRDRGATRRD